MVMANPNHAMYNHVSHIFHIISQIPIIPRVGQNRRILGDFPAKSTVYIHQL